MLENIDTIKSVFNARPNDKDKEAPRNIRSLKCALHDFYRIYQKLEEKHIPDLARYFYSFLAYTMAEKAGLATKGKYGYIESDHKIKEIYPFFKNDTLLFASRKWILNGDWDEKLLEAEINAILERTQADTPTKLLRSYRLNCLDEETIREGFPELLGAAYEGSLSLEEYEGLVFNIYLSRKYGVSIPTVDWQALKSGIEKRFQTDIETHDAKERPFIPWDADQQAKLSEEEREIYQILLEHRKSKPFAINRQDYIDELSKNGVSSFILFTDKQFNIFDDEMAEVTARCFRECSQSDKAAFADSFNGVWRHCASSGDTKKYETKQGLESLAERFKAIEEEFKDSGHTIAAHHAKKVIETVNELIEILDEAIATEEKRYTVDET